MTSKWGSEMKTEVLESVPDAHAERELHDLKFKFEEAAASGKTVFIVYGEKGVGKTSFSMGFPGNISVLSLDRKGVAAKMNYHNNDSRIKVYDAVKYYERTEDKVLKTAVTTVEYIYFILENIRKSSPDWVIIDGVEILQKIAENYMREKNGLKPYQGVANLNLWKVRNAILDDIHHTAIDITKKGVIYTTYTQLEEIVEEGTLVTKQKVPKYVDTIMWESDIVLFVENKFDAKNKTNKFLLRCLTSKNDKIIPTGKIVDISKKKATEVLQL